MAEKNPKVILIEDDRWMADSLSETLEGISVKTVTNPEDTFAEIEIQKPDLVLADVTLGQKNIFVLLNEMQSYSDTRQIPVIILSSSAAKLNLDDLGAYGVMAIIDKGTATPDKISAEIRRIIMEMDGKR